MTQIYRKVPKGYRPTIAPSEAPRVAAMRSIVSPILLLGVEAPAVTPIVSGPRGSHASRRCSTFAPTGRKRMVPAAASMQLASSMRSEEHTSELQSRLHLVCRLLLEKKKKHEIEL